MKELVVDNQKKRVKTIEFGILNANEVQAQSELEIYNRDFYNPVNRTPARGGILDPKMGVSGKDATCETCGLKLAECAGHWGFIRLALPVFHAGFFKATQQILQQICKSCSKVLLEVDDRRAYLRKLRNPSLDNPQKMAIIKAITSACKKVHTCPYCGDLNGTVKKAGVLRLVHEKYKSKSKSAEFELAKNQFYQKFNKLCQESPEFKAHLQKAQDDLTPLKVFDLFTRISSEDCELLGLNVDSGRPETFLWTTIPVPPVCIRPSVAMDKGDAGSNEDDITVKLAEAIMLNQMILKSLQDGDTSLRVSEDWELLQLTLAQLVNSELPNLANATQTTKWIRGVCQRLKGKQGRFRGNLSGKRVDFSARTVISPDPNLRIDQVAVPDLVAKTLTYTEVVTEFNIQRLKQCVINGPDKHPGANFMQQQGKPKRFLKFVVDRSQLARELKIGDEVERHLMDGDVVLFNRQPSLHKLSIMSFYAIVKPWKTFRFNECVCTPFNADFDGDEMNLHVPQTEEAKAEAVVLMGSKNNLVTPRNGQPLIAATQDFITGAYLITKKDSFYTKEEFVQICCSMFDANERIDLPDPVILKPQVLYTGKQVFNILMRPNKQSQVFINLECKNKSFVKNPDIPVYKCPNDGWVAVHNSEVLSGVIDKSIVGDGNKDSILYVALKDYGPEVAGFFMNRLAKLCARFMQNRGFSIGLEDVAPGERLWQRRDEVIKAGYQECDGYIEQYKQGTLQCQAGCNEDQTLEAQMSGKLSKIRDDLGQICLQELNKHNSPLIMAVCGSKGSKINVCQMTACVGQQIINGSRIADGFDERTLPHFKRRSRDPASKGFVKNSFYTGMSPTEFFFHAASGREGLVDTSVKSVTGDTALVIIEDGKSKRVLIGDWIDSLMSVNGSHVTLQQEYDTELLKIGNDAAVSNQVYIPTTNSDGYVSWAQVTAVTRHDPGEVLYEVKTRGGRSVTVVESKSLLIYDKITRKFEEKLTSQIVIGDQMPVTMQLAEPAVTVQYVDIQDYLPEDVYANCLDEYSRAPDQFQLDNENGVFIGLYLAQGDYDIQSGRISISNSDKNVQNFVESQFDKLNIPWEHTTVKSPKDGIRQSINGCSMLFAWFMKKLLGSEAGQKFVPDVAFSAPMEFVIGLLDGYFTGNGSVSEYSIDSGAASLRLSEGIAMLCSRLGAFGSIQVDNNESNEFDNVLPQHRVVFCAQWAQVLKDNLTMLIPEKDRQLKSMQCSLQHRNYAFQNDVVLDEIVEIVKMPTQPGMKVYDLTVPSTLNFGLANGLHVFDTAETGYMQRRLMKALEDLSVSYDYSVRSSVGSMIQFEYGNDKLDPTSMEGNDVPVDFNKNFLACMNLHRAQDDDLLLLPDQVCDLVKQLVMDGEFLQHCPQQYGDSVVAFVQDKVAPKASTPGFKVTQKILENFVNVCRRKYYKSKIEPGSAVGALAAQSIGEPGTQMTLKTFHFAGVASMSITLGVPRIKEIINASKLIKTPIITAKLVKDDNQTVARIVKGRIEATKLGQVVEYVQEVISGSACYLDLKVDWEAIRQLQLEIDESSICTAIAKAPKLKVGASDIQMSKKNQAIRILVHDAKKADSAFYELQRVKRLITDVIICGIPTVNRAVINEQQGKSGHYELLAEGYGLRQVMTTDGVVGLESTSNHIAEVESVLGIEAARQSIIDQIQYTMSSHGMTIDSRHVMILADIMTFKGEVLGITRFGIAKMKDSVLMLASFEKTTDHLFDASTYSKVDHIEGVSERIIMGVHMNVGTGAFKILQQVDLSEDQNGGSDEGSSALQKKSYPQKDQKKQSLYQRPLLFDVPEYHPSIFAQG
ncbi:hypothetical protein MP228_010450 [Amoeboaphelidium protococcarum]|nr:hypothetical protein MP228_010450 [Amoeboaphelidium protococcarum]